MEVQLLDKLLIRDIQLNDMTYKDFVKSVNQCNKCEFRSYSDGALLPIVNRPKVMVISRLSGVVDYKNNTILSPTTGVGKLLDKYLSVLNLDRRDAYITNTVLCMKPNKTNIDLDSSFKCFHTWKGTELQFIEVPKLILLLGNDALTTMYGEIGAVNDFIGSIFRTTILNTKSLVVPLHHPFTVFRSPEAYKENYYMIEYLRRLIYGDKDSN